MGCPFLARKNPITLAGKAQKRETKPIVYPAYS